jgi:hypothetical protein
MDILRKGIKLPNLFIQYCIAIITKTIILPITNYPQHHIFFLQLFPKIPAKVLLEIIPQHTPEKIS